MMPALLALLATLVLQAGPPRPPAGQVPPATEGTAVVRGRVIDKASGAPIARAVVTLQSTRTRVSVQNVADDRGGFEFARLAAGAYDLRATAGEFRHTHLTAIYSPPGQDGPAQLLLKDGEQRTDIVLALPAALAVSGRVVDDEGHPLANVRVILRQPGSDEQMSPTGQQRSTDDRGMFRIHSVAPGRYAVCAEPSSGMFFDSPGQQPTRRRKFVTTCYPSAAPAPGRELVLGDMDVEHVEIRLQRQDTFFIKGSALSADGTVPSEGWVDVNRLERNRTSGTSTRLAADGTFTVSNVVPGTYSVAVRIGRNERSFPPDEREPEWAATRVEVTTADVDGVLLQMRRGATLKGRLVFEDPLEAPPSEPLRIEGRPVEYTGSTPMADPAKVETDGTFTLSGVFGPVVVRPMGALPRGYVLKSVSYRGRDVTGIPTEFSAEKGQDAEIIVTNRTSELSGQVTDEKGQPAASATVLYFPVDPERWPYAARFERTTALAAAKPYRISAMVPGEYFVVALTRTDFASLRFPDDYERVASVAERITILERERRTADLRLATLPERKPR
jgi:protocatechuate 3,4-dioxygenase beta subunit